MISMLLVGRPDRRAQRRDDGVERRAQLVAHIGEELRLVLARQLELPALVLDFMEQPRMLNSGSNSHWGFELGKERR